MQKPFLIFSFGKRFHNFSFQTKKEWFLFICTFLWQHNNEILSIPDDLKCCKNILACNIAVNRLFSLSQLKISVFFCFQSIQLLFENQVCNLNNLFLVYFPFSFFLWQKKWTTFLIDLCNMLKEVKNRSIECEQIKLWIQNESTNSAFDNFTHFFHLLHAYPLICVIVLELFLL